MPQLDQGMPRQARRQGGLVLGLILLGLGIVFLLREYGFLDPIEFWPWILIVIGIALIVSHFTRRF